MTKEIIIDGVDVAECVRLWNGQCTGKDNKLLGNCIDLDCELKQLKRLEQENEKLKQQLEIDKNQINYFIEENERLSELTCVNCGEKYLTPDGSELYEENERLKEENAELKAYKDVNEDFKTAWEELKEDYKKLYQQKDLDNARWQKRCTDLHIEDKAKADKYWLILQEIKAIVLGDYEMLDPQALQEIRSLITKAEEE